MKIQNPSDQQERSHVRALAIYLPQFHPIPENDEWWSPGFTEWTNTARARPFFRGHYQPHVPADLGYYDLRLSETRVAQAELARRNGIEGFCYYHYWFAGRRLLERPFNEVLASGSPDFPFCLYWANESWSGVWHGAPKRMLIEQTYPGVDDHIRHFESLLPAFLDSRYIKVDGKPLFVVYRPGSIPQSEAWTELWNTLAQKAGLPGIYFVATEHNLNEPVRGGFDARVFVNVAHREIWYDWSSPFKKLSRNLSKALGRPVVQSYASAIARMLPNVLPDETTFPTVIPNWDNTPRSGVRGVVLHDSTPAQFRTLMQRAIRLVEGYPDETRFLFIKSWNEWAEGNYVEPDLKFGHAYLDVIREELERG